MHLPGLPVSSPDKPSTDVHATHAVRAGDDAAGRIGDVAVRLPEVRDVEQVEDLAAELQAGRADWEALAEREVEHLRARADQRVAANHPLESRRRKHVRRPVEPLRL